MAFHAYFTNEQTRQDWLMPRLCCDLDNLFLNWNNFFHPQFVGPIKVHGFALPVCWSIVEGTCMSDLFAFLLVAAWRSRFLKWLHAHRYVNGHAKKHYEENQAAGLCQKRCEKPDKERHPHSVCMDCSNYSVFWYVTTIAASTDWRTYGCTESTRVKCLVASVVLTLGIWFD